MGSGTAHLKGAIALKKLISVISSGMIALTAFVSGAVSTGADETAEQSVYTVQDVQNLQNFLLAKPAEETLKDKPYDLNHDGVWNVYDLCLMKRQLLNQPENETSNILVAYFSCTGNTETIAEYLIDLTDADSYTIEAAVPYTNEDIQYSNSSCRANQEQNDKSVRPEISGAIDNMESYDIVFLGYPIWWGEEPRIIDTFLESYDFSDKTVIPFCTSGSSGISASENNIRNLVPIGEQLSGKRFSANASVDDVSAWLDTLDLPLKAEEQKLNIDVNGYTLTVSLADNSSAQALKKLLKDAPLTLELHDYGNFEKVGALPETLPRNDERITTEPGDLILYQGNQITIYYDVNTWNFTKLGHIDNITQEELKEILGDGSVTVTFSLAEQGAKS